MSHLFTPGEHIVGRALGALALVGVAVPLFGGGVWLWTTKTSLSKSDIVRVLGWCSAGMLPLSIFAVLILIYEGQHGVTLAEPLVVLLWITGGGAVGGFFTGIYDVQRRRARRNQQATADRLSALIEAAPVSIIEHDPGGTVRLWNRKAEQVFGWEAENVVGKPLPFLSEEIDPEFEALRDRMRRGERLGNVEIRRRTKDGNPREFLLSTAPIYDENGTTISSIIEVLVDITEQKQRRERLDLFRTLLDHSNDSIFVIDPTTGEFVDVNETACRTLGYERDDLLERTVTDIEATLSAGQEWQDHIATVRDAGSTIFEGKHQCKDGSTFPVEVNIAHVELKHGREYTVAIARDITARKQRKQELKRFHRAVDQAGHAIYLTDIDGTIEYANPAFEDITGYSPDEAVGSDPSILQSGEHDDEYYRHLWSTILDGQVWEEEITDRRKSGKLYTARQTIAPIYDDDTIDGFVAIQSDMTAQKVREQRISVLNRILRHNLRTAINVIAGRADLLLQELEDEDLREHATKIDEQARTLESLGEKANTVKTALDRTHSATHPVSVADVLTQTLELHQSANPEADISIADPVPDSIAVDAKIRPVLEELVENAISHTDQAHPTVRIAVTVDQYTQQVSIAVADDGPGIPDLERTTLREGIESPLQHGSGIGLWLVKWVTTALGGKVDIDHNVPRGSVVTVTLPVASGSDHDSKESAPIDGSETQYEDETPHTNPDD